MANNICPIHTQLMQNYINIFRIDILTLTFFIHSLSHYQNLSIAPTFMTSQHIGFFPKCRLIFSQNVSRHIRFFLKCRPTFSKHHFKWGWGCRGGEGLKTKCRRHFWNVNRHLKHCILHTKLYLWQRTTTYMLLNFTCGGQLLKCNDRMNLCLLIKDKVLTPEV